MRKYLPVLLFVVLCLAIALLWRNHSKVDGDPLAASLADLGPSISATQARGPSYVAIIGDSITVAAPHQPVCGRPLAVAAVGGTRIIHALRDILPHLQKSPPAALLIALGTNDSKRWIRKTRAQKLADFKAEYRTLLTAAKVASANVGVVMIPPVGKGEGDAGFEAAIIAEFNEIIQVLATEAGVPTFSLAGLAGADGFARVGLTTDGVHLSAAGYGIWMDVVGQAWTAVKPCQ
jgi:GDSL-like Lipase/Acylhydrolase family